MHPAYLGLYRPVGDPRLANPYPHLECQFGTLDLRHQHQPNLLAHLAYLGLYLEVLSVRLEVPYQHPPYLGQCPPVVVEVPVSQAQSLACLDRTKTPPVQDLQDPLADRP